MWFTEMFLFEKLKTTKLRLNFTVFKIITTSQAPRPIVSKIYTSQLTYVIQIVKSRFKDLNHQRGRIDNLVGCVRWPDLIPEYEEME